MRVLRTVAEAAVRKSLHTAGADKREPALTKTGVKECLRLCVTVSVDKYIEE